MTRLKFTILFLLLATSFASAATPPYFSVHYEAATNDSELKLAATYTVWLPPGVKKLRGVIVHQHGCGDGASKGSATAAYDLHWQALAEKHQCALLGTTYAQADQQPCRWWCDPRNGSDQRFLQGLSDLAALSQHPELATVPWALWGHSGGAIWSCNMLLLHPDRIAAVWLRSLAARPGPPFENTPVLEISSAARAVPVMCNLGIQECFLEKTNRFAFVWEAVEPFFKEFRGAGGLIGLAIDPNSSHDCGTSRYLAIPWFDACLTARLPRKAGDATLKPMPTKKAWLAPWLGKQAQPATKFIGDTNTSTWLPDERIAKAWSEYVTDGNVHDTTPPPAPTDVKIDAHGELTWNATADFESGITAFLIERDGQRLARIPEKDPTYYMGRPLFQGISYGDTPNTPLATMHYRDKTATPGQPHRYTVRTVNSVGLSSKPAH